MDRGEEAMKQISLKDISEKSVLTIIAIFLVTISILWEYFPMAAVRIILLGFGIIMILLIWLWSQKEWRWQSDFANSICEALDMLMDDQELKNYQPYEDSMVSKIQGKLLQYHEKMQEGQWQSIQDKQTIQELVSDISHQVKTPIANIRMFAGILQQHSLSSERRTEFLNTMTIQMNKLDFLMQSLIKMSRLETGTFVLHIGNLSLYDTIAQSINGIWAKADSKKIQIDVECDSHIMAEHDAKWTAEALGNILDNAVKYTPTGGEIHVRVLPWQFYVRIDIEDNGIGIPKKHYHDVFKRFYRAQEVVQEEGVGLGLYLSRCIITHEKGYITVKSEVGKGTVFSVFLPASGEGINQWKS